MSAIENHIPANAATTAAVDTLVEQARQAFKEDSVLAFEYIDKAIALAVQLKYRQGEGTALAFRGFMLRFAGNFDEALDFYLRALACFEMEQNLPTQASTHNNLGVCYTCISNYTAALDHYHRALQLHESLGNSTGVAQVTNNIGTVYDNIGDNDKALESYLAALELNRKNGNRDLIARNNTNIGVVYRNLKRFEEAIAYFEKALATHREENDQQALAMNYGNIAVVCEEMGAYSRALDHGQQALELSYTVGDKDMIAFNAGTLGNIYTALKQYNKAEEFLRLSLKVAIEVHSLKWQKTAYNSLVTFYEAQERWKEALESYRKADEINTLLKQEDVQRKAITMEMQKKLSAEEAVRRTTEKILYNILPPKIADRIRTGEEDIIERHEHCSVMFADIVGFTNWSAGMEVKELAGHLNRLFQLFDELALEHGVEKIKTIGDAYLCVAGLPEPCADHARRIAQMALGMMKRVNEAYPNGDIRLRIGIHAGEVIAGVLGKNKYAYDLWGDTVNTASRMEAFGLAGKIHCTESFRNLLHTAFVFERRGEVEIKGKGKMETWLLLAPC